MKVKRKTIQLIIVINLSISILLISVGQEIIVSEFISYYFWLSLGMFLGHRIAY